MHEQWASAYFTPPVCVHCRLLVHVWVHQVCVVWSTSVGKVQHVRRKGRGEDRRQCLCKIFILKLSTVASSSPYRSSFLSPDSLLQCSALWSRQCDPHSPVAAPTVWWQGSSQLHNHCQSRPQSSHHQWNKCSSHCALQCDTHCQYCGHQL